MFSSPKMDRAQRGPGVFEIIFGVALSVWLGVMIAAIHLVFKPVEVVDETPETRVPGQVYFVEGSVDGSKARQWTRKRQMLADGDAADVSFTEEELNAWIASATPKTRQGSKEDAELFAPERINFRIRDDVFQAGMLGKFNIAGWTPNMVFQTRGKFEPGESGFKYTPDELYLGSLPVHKVPMLAPFFVKRVLAAQELPEDVTDTWEKLKLVAVEGNVLRLVLP